MLLCLLSPAGLRSAQGLGHLVGGCVGERPVRQGWLHLCPGPGQHGYLPWGSCECLASAPVDLPSATDSVRGDVEGVSQPGCPPTWLGVLLPSAETVLAPTLRTYLLSRPRQGKSQSVDTRSCACLSWLSLELPFGPGSTPGPRPGPRASGWGSRGCWPRASAPKPGGRLESWLALRRGLLCFLMREVEETLYGVCRGVRCH